MNTKKSKLYSVKIRNVNRRIFDKVANRWYIHDDWRKCLSVIRHELKLKEEWFEYINTKKADVDADVYIKYSKHYFRVYSYNKEYTDICKKILDEVCDYGDDWRLYRM